MNSTPSEKNPKYFYEKEEFPELKVLEQNYLTIQKELLTLREDLSNGFWLNSFPGYLNSESESIWKLFTLMYMQIKHPLNCSMCPETIKLLNKIPTILSADFSYLPAHTKINSHVGFTPTVLRVHLGLVIPSDCGLRVGNTVKNWEEGKILVFDDSFEHEAWNNSSADRFVLMVDIKNPRYKYSAEEISRYQIENMKEKFMLDLFTKEQWLDFYKKKEFTIFPAK